MEWDDYLRQQAATYRQLAEKAEDAVVKKVNSSTWQTSAKRSPITSRIVLQAGKWHEPISHSARRARLQSASEEADGVLLDGNGNKGPGRSLRDTLTARQASRTGCAIPWHGTHEAAIKLLGGAAAAWPLAARAAIRSSQTFALCNLAVRR